LCVIERARIALTLVGGHEFSPFQLRATMRYNGLRPVAQIQFFPDTWWVVTS
jgi:hypothetical protein